MTGGHRAIVSTLSPSVTFILILLWVDSKSGEESRRTMMEMYRTMFGISDGFVVHSESTNCPMAAPSGLAKLARAVALVRPLSENQRSL